MKIIQSLFTGLVLTTLFLLFSNFSNAQLSQDHITEEMAARMDENKVLGKPVLDGIFGQFDLTFSGIETSSRMNQLISLLEDNLNCEMVISELENSRLVFIIPAQFGLDEVKQVISEHGMGLGILNEQSYFVRN